MTAAKMDWTARAREVGGICAERAAQHDRTGDFVAGNYTELKRAGLLSAAIPADLGGGGATHAEVCQILRELGRHCGSTSLALSMHTHLVSAAVWRHLHGLPAEALLRNVAAKNLVLVSTGASDWLQSNGTLERVDGGYKFSGSKIFGSGSPVGDLMITSARYSDPKEGPQVLHFSVPMSDPGVTLGNDWDTLGMRGTGSQTIRIENAFVPDDRITVRRPAQGWHPAWSVVAVVALPIVMGTYVGVADSARDLAVEQAKRRESEPQTAVLVRELENAHASARLAWEAGIANAANYDFEPKMELANQSLMYKTLTTNAVLHTVAKALEVAGGIGFFRRFGLEQLFRDAQGAQYHPLPEKKQQIFTGRIALGLDPVG